LVSSEKTRESSNKGKVGEIYFQENIRENSGNLAKNTGIFSEKIKCN